MQESQETRGVHHDEVVTLLTELRTAQSILLKQVDTLSSTVGTLLSTVQAFERWMAVHDEYTRSKIEEFGEVKRHVGELRIDVNDLRDWRRLSEAHRRANAWRSKLLWILAAGAAAGIVDVLRWMAHKLK